MTLTIRPISECEIGRLADFLYLAIHQPDPDNPIPRGVLEEPAVAVYIDDWGKPDDRCLVAVDREQIVGAVWTRILAGEIRGYGNVDPTTPEFTVSVLPERRGEGIGSLLMRNMLDLLKAQGYERASLSVQKTNPARRLYERLGFRAVADRGDDLVMAHRLEA